MNSISDIKHAFYINLDSRPDRKEYIENHLKKVGLNAKRFNAVKLKNGAIGCSLSHLKLLEMAKENELDYIMILEDDIQFTKPEIFISQFNKFLQLNDNYDVVLIAGNNMPPFLTNDETCVKVTKCQTTTGYMVRKHYYTTLIENYREGIKLLMEYPNEHRFYAIDKYWFHLQQRDKWYLITPLTVTQRCDYSDIEKRPTNYTRLMLDLDKKKFFNKPKPSLNMNLT